MGRNDVSQSWGDGRSPKHRAPVLTRFANHLLAVT